MPVAIAQLNVNPKHIVINFIKAQTIIQLNAHNTKKINNVIIFISPFLSNLPAYVNINSPDYLSIRDTGRFSRASPHICKTRSICQSKPLYIRLPLFFSPFIGSHWSFSASQIMHGCSKVSLFTNLQLQQLWNTISGSHFLNSL